MDILQTLQQKREVSKIRRHPLSSFTVNERYSYLFGLATLAQGNIKTLKELEQPYQKIMDLLDIPSGYGKETIVDINNHFDKCFDQMFHFLSKDKRIAQCFIIDLLKLKQYTSWGRDYCDEVIKQYCFVLKIHEMMVQFMEAFIKESYNGNSERAHYLNNELKSNGMKLDYDLLNYMNPHFYAKHRYESLNLDKGSTFRIENDTIVEGDIYVTNGSKLYITNADLQLKGSLIIRGGRVVICNSNINSMDKGMKKNYLIYAEKIHELRIEDSRINGNHNCSAVFQDIGNLVLVNTVIENCMGDYAVVFSGQNIDIHDSQFYHCANGAICIRERANVDLLNCYFEDCMAEHGAAMYLATLGTVHIRECRFFRCVAKYLGGAVYFQYKRYGQQVLGCEMKECEPAQNAVFNAYELVTR